MLLVAGNQWPGLNMFSGWWQSSTAPDTNTNYIFSTLSDTASPGQYETADVHLCSVWWSLAVQPLIEWLKCWNKLLVLNHMTNIYIWQFSHIIQHMATSTYLISVDEEINSRGSCGEKNWLFFGLVMMTTGQSPNFASVKDIRSWSKAITRNLNLK